MVLVSDRGDGSSTEEERASMVLSLPFLFGGLPFPFLNNPSPSHLEIPSKVPLSIYVMVPWGDDIDDQSILVASSGEKM